jgi:hypothetical protein
MMRIGWRAGIPWAGLVTGPGAWALNQQLNYTLVPWICAHKVNPVPLISLTFAAIALLGSFLSWRALQTGKQSIADTHQGGHPYDFLAGIGIFIAVLFAAVILLQGAAGLVFHGCER